MLTGLGDFTNVLECSVLINFQILHASNKQNYLLVVDRDKIYFSSLSIKMSQDSGQHHSLGYGARRHSSPVSISLLMIFLSLLSSIWYYKTSLRCVSVWGKAQGKLDQIKGKGYLEW